MVAPQDPLNGVECPTDTQEVLTPALGVPFLGDHVSQLMKTQHATGESLGREEADPTTVLTAGVGMGLGSESTPDTALHTTTTEHTLYLRMLQLLRPIFFG
jgi:hypothetical protein